MDPTLIMSKLGESQALVVPKSPILGSLAAIVEGYTERVVLINRMLISLCTR